MKFLRIGHFVDENKIGAVLLTVFGIGLLLFLPETIASARLIFAAFGMMLAWRFCGSFRQQKLRRRELIAAGILALALIFAGVETGAKIAIAGSFILISCSMLRAMLLTQNPLERIAIAAAGIAALLFGLGTIVKIARLDLVECRLVFSAASFAGALTLFLRPQDRRKI